MGSTTASSSLLVRPCGPADHDVAAALLYESSGGMYDRYAGNRTLAERALRRSLDRERTTASSDVVHVAELDGRVVGAIAAMPYDEWVPRAHRFLRVTLASIPPWRWPGTLAVYRVSGRSAPKPPRPSLYIDSLAVAPEHRRRGVGRALLNEAERLAATRGLGAVSLDTWADNDAARALYREAGFLEVASAPPRGQVPGGIALRKEL